MHRFLRGEHPRILNVFASGEKPLAQVDRELASGNREPTSLFNVLSTSAVMNEIMLIGLVEKDPNVSGEVTLVSTHPGMLKTDLRRGQAWWFDVIEAIVVSLAGFSEEECGVWHKTRKYPGIRQATCGESIVRRHVYGGTRKKSRIANGILKLKNAKKSIKNSHFGHVKIAL